MERNRINKLTGMPLTESAYEILERLESNVTVSIEEIRNIDEMKEAYSCINAAVSTINLKNRENIQKGVLTKLDKMGSAVIDDKGQVVYNGEVKKERRIDIVIGLPASGKSSTLVNPISQQYKSRIIDSDEAKKLLPEFNDGWGAGVVHDESKYISIKQLQVALKSEENIVYPIVGSNFAPLVSIITDIKKNYHYNIYLHYNEIQKNKALGRMLIRFFEEGRFLDPTLIYGYGNRVEENFNTLKGGNLIDGYSKWNNDVPRGEKPKCTERTEGCLSGFVFGNGRNGGAERTNDCSITASAGTGGSKSTVTGAINDNFRNGRGVGGGIPSVVERVHSKESFAGIHGKEIRDIQKHAEHTTIVINAFGGPGAGKSTASLGIAEELKKQGYMAEYVSEYAKELVWDENWDMLNGTEEHQFTILLEQIKRIDRLMGKVDFIITDAPILLNQIYNNELKPEYVQMLSQLYGQYKNFNFVVQRNDNQFETEGRIHNFKESRQKDNEILKMLDNYGIYYGVYNHDSVNKIIPNVVKTHHRISNIRSKWYIAKETDSQPFASFLEKDQKKSVLLKLDQNKNEISKKDSMAEEHINTHTQKDNER